MKKKKRKIVKSKIINTILFGLILICVGLLILLLFLDDKTLTPDYAPGTIDTNAIKEKDDKDKMDISQGGGAVSLSYSNVVAVELEKKCAQLYFKNPSKSREDIMIQVIVLQDDEEIVIAESELIPAGYAIYKLELKEEIYLQKGGYNGKFKITYYNEETGAKEIVDTAIEISIDVK